MHPLDYVLMPAVHKYTILAILISNTPGRVYTIQCRLHSGITTVAAVCGLDRVCLILSLSSVWSRALPRAR